MQDKDTLLEAFDHAWVRNAERIDRWRLLAKLGQHRLILEEKAIQHMMSSEIPKDWLVFVEEVIRGKLLSEFKVVWAEVGGEPLIRHVCREGAPIGFEYRPFSQHFMLANAMNSVRLVDIIGRKSFFVRIPLPVRSNPRGQPDLAHRARKAGYLERSAIVCWSLPISYKNLQNQTLGILLCS
ncbi:MAG: hypothetical protein R3F40_10030 [Candidatus Competibacteraceae bacterium]